MPPPSSATIAAVPTASTPGTPSNRSRILSCHVCRLILVIPAEREIDPDTTSIPSRRKPGSIARRGPQRAHEQSGDDHQHQPERHLRDEKEVTQPLTCAAHPPMTAGR